MLCVWQLEVNTTCKGGWRFVPLQVLAYDLAVCGEGFVPWKVTPECFR